MPHEKGRKTALAKAAEDLLRQARAGEIHCVALRILRADGTFEDVVAGGTPEEQAEVLRKLREQH